MLLRTFAAACYAVFLCSAGAFAQAPAPGLAPPSSPATTDAPIRPSRARHPRATPAPAETVGTPAASQPAAPAAQPSPRPAARAAALPAGTKIDVNTATPAQLDTLPSIGKARLKAIMDERAKSPFKDWDDFERRMQHTSVNKGAQAKIKDYVSF